MPPIDSVIHQFVSMFTISSSITYVDLLLVNFSDYTIWCNWVVAFCLKTFGKWFLFPHFPHISPHAGQSSGDLMFPLSPTVSTRCFLLSTSLPLVIVSFSARIIYLIFLWVVTIWPVFSSNSLPPPHCVAFGTAVALVIGKWWYICRASFPVVASGVVTLIFFIFVS